MNIRTLRTLAAFLCLLSVIFLPSGVQAQQPKPMHANNSGNGNGQPKQVIQFAPDPTKFPKCVGDAIQASDFIVVTNSTAADNAAAQGTVSFPKGTTQSGSLTATVHWPANASTQSCSYTVLAGGIYETLKTPKTINNSFTNLKVTSILPSFDSSSTVEEITYRRGTNVGTGVFHLTDWNDWSACGGNSTYSSSKGLNKGGAFSLTFGDDVKAQFQGQAIWTSSTTCGTNYGPFSNHKVRIRIYSQTLDITTSGSITSTQTELITMFGTQFSPIDKTVYSFSETSSGNADPAATGLQECCGSSN